MPKAKAKKSKHKKSKFRATIGKIARKEGGKSQAKMGDVQQLQSLFFQQCATDPGFLAHGLTLAAAKVKRQRGRWVKYRNRYLARKKGKKLPKL